MIELTRLIELIELMLGWGLRGAERRGHGARRSAQGARQYNLLVTCYLLLDADTGYWVLKSLKLKKMLSVYICENLCPI